MHVHHSHKPDPIHISVHNLTDDSPPEYQVCMSLDGTLIYMGQFEAMWLSASLSAACAGNEKEPRQYVNAGLNDEYRRIKTVGTE